MLTILEEPDDSQDMEDKVFSAFYENSDQVTAEQEEIRKIWIEGEKNRYSYPGISRRMN
jgi:hypothetical protein